MKRFQRPLFLFGISIALVVLVASGLILTEEPVNAQRSAKTKLHEAEATDQLRSSAASPTAAFSPGNLVIYRVGDGVAALSSAAAAVFLDEYTPAGVLVQSIPLPVAVNGSNRRLTSAGSSTSEGFITRSTDGNFLLLAGYDAAVGTPTVAGTTATVANRVIGRVGANGGVDTTTALGDAASGGNPRGAASTNGTDLWFSGSTGGVRYTTFGATTSTQLVTTPTNIRGVAVSGGQLFVSAQSGAFRLASVGTGTPTTSGQTITNLPGLPTATNSPYGFFFADLDAGVAGIDTLYFADDAASSPAGIYKYSLVGATWVPNGTIALATARGLTGSVSGSAVSLYVTNGGTFQTLTDTSGYNATIGGTPSSVATAPANTAFRGIAFAPASRKALVDMNGDGRTDYTVARPVGASLAGALDSIAGQLRLSGREKIRARMAGGQSGLQQGGSFPIEWWTQHNNGSIAGAVQWGNFNSDEPLVADFDGDGKDDITVWRRPDTFGDQAYFYSINSSDFTAREHPFGTKDDNPFVVADYDGDGTDDPAVFRCPQVTPGQCYFFYRGTQNNPQGNITFVPFGQGNVDTFLPLRGDFNGDGKNDFALQTAAPWDPDAAVFYLAMNGTFAFESYQWGRFLDRLIPGDFDGDGKSDITVTRTISGQLWWFVLERDGGTQSVQWGGNLLDFEAPGDYDGDGKDDFAVYRWNASSSTFWILPSSGAPYYSFDWGAPGDVPIANIFTQ